MMDKQFIKENLVLDVRINYIKQIFNSYVEGLRLRAFTQVKVEWKLDIGMCLIIYFSEWVSESVNAMALFSFI